MTRARPPVLQAPLLALLLASCGARSTLREDGAGAGGSGGDPVTASGSGAGVLGGGGSGGDGGDGGVPSSTSTDVVSSSVTNSVTSSSSVSSSTGPICIDALDCDDRVDCTIDSCTPDGCVHVADASACDDGLLCTSDSCDPSLGCSSAHSDAVCEDFIACTLDACDALSDQCVNDPCDGLCDDAQFCNGVARCDSAFGCTPGPPACTDVPCASSLCSEGFNTCVNTFAPGCVAPDVQLLITDAQGRLFRLSPYQSPSSTLIAATNGVTHLDIAVLGGRWFVLDNSLKELTPGTNQVIATLDAVFANSLGAGPDGMLYAASTQVYRLDPDTGASTTLGDLPEGHSSSGDIAFLGARMFVSTDSPCGGALVEFDVDTGAATVLGGDGLGCVWGLAAIGGALYVVNCDGTIGTFDPDTGEVDIFSTTLVSVYGADALP